LLDEQVLVVQMHAFTQIAGKIMAGKLIMPADTTAELPN
jgi:hypothetical protein